MSIATGICSLSLHSIGRNITDDVHYNVMPVRSVFRSVIEQTFKEECPCILVMPLYTRSLKSCNCLF